MNTIDVVMKVPKESKEVVDALVILVKDIKAKKPIGELAANALPKVIAAAEGFDQVGGEVKSEGRDELAGYLVQQIFSALDSPVANA